ncbi:nucleotide-binding protein [Salinispira pacifica]
MTTVIPVASGKGGVGKTVFSANLGVALARRGKTVILADLDLGGSNLHTCLGVRNSHTGIGNYIFNQADSLESLVVETPEPHLFFIPGDALLPGTANLPYFRKMKILRELSALVADFVILDLGSGSSFNTIDFFLSSGTGIIVTTPETTAVLNAYSFLKTALYRLIFRTFRPKSEERRVIREFISRKIEGTGLSFQTLIEEVAQVDPESGKSAAAQLAQFNPRVVLNMGRGRSDQPLGNKLKEIAERNLSVVLEYVGILPTDPAVPRSIFERRPTISLHPESPYSLAVTQVARALAASPEHEIPVLHEDDDDILATQQDSSAEVPELGGPSSPYEL